MSKEIISDMKDKNVLIVGTGKSGKKAAAQAMVKLGEHTFRSRIISRRTRWILSWRHI